MPLPRAHLLGNLGDGPDHLVGQLAGRLVHRARTFGGAGRFLEGRADGLQPGQHLVGLELQGCGAVGDRLDADLGRGLHLLRQIGQVAAPHRLPAAVEVAMDQIAALALAEDLGQPVGRRDEPGHFVPRRAARAAPTSVSAWVMASSVSVASASGPRDRAENRQRPRRRLPRRRQRHHGDMDKHGPAHRAAQCSAPDAGSTTRRASGSSTTAVRRSARVNCRMLFSSRARAPDAGRRRNEARPQRRPEWLPAIFLPSGELTEGLEFVNHAVAAPPARLPAVPGSSRACRPGPRAAFAAAIRPTFALTPRAAIGLRWRAWPRGRAVGT